MFLVQLCKHIIFSLSLSLHQWCSCRQSGAIGGPESVGLEQNRQCLVQYSVGMSWDKKRYHYIVCTGAFSPLSLTIKPHAMDPQLLGRIGISWSHGSVHSSWLNLLLPALLGPKAFALRVRKKRRCFRQPSERISTRPSSQHKTIWTCWHQLVQLIHTYIHIDIYIYTSIQYIYIYTYLHIHVATPIHILPSPCKEGFVKVNESPLCELFNQ